ncbi:ABC transporter ATP-binding protein [Cryobacterium sp. CG_9.6]|uniref:ABC transporter ATP-binding protein n=1 Tax=Cryobacterium sp. CG_9.6 TaxID=2760710 RepID=UPI002475EDAB|nr:ABC transporter ATP-binding protein [Cryobacterium sp. CG_9.6]MDH6237547.1 putative ABC transport system ATP-binding protein [Cryobacterium sp. CG_9.6]
MPAEWVIDATDLEKSYGSGSSRFDALKGVSLQVAPGETVAIVGKSGSGKSTLMHLLALLDAPDKGTLRVADQDARGLSKRAVNELRNKEFGFVFQQFFLTPNVSVLDNVTLPLKIAGIRSKARRQRGHEVLQQLELDDKASKKATTLSGGQKQRVVIGRALVNNPRVIFADEPTGNLDSTTGRVVEDILFALNRDQGITLVIVTHDEDLAARCDRQIYIRDGLIVNETTSAMRSAPAHAGAHAATAPPVTSPPVTAPHTTGGAA